MFDAIRDKPDGPFDAICFLLDKCTNFEITCLSEWFLKPVLLICAQACRHLSVSIALANALRLSFYLHFITIRPVKISYRSLLLRLEVSSCGFTICLLLIRNILILTATCVKIPITTRQNSSLDRVFPLRRIFMKMPQEFLPQSNPL